MWHLELTDTQSIAAIIIAKIVKLSRFNIYKYFLLIRIADEGSIPEMPIWSILLIQFDFTMVYPSKQKSLYFWYFSQKI